MYSDGNRGAWFSTSATLSMPWYQPDKWSKDEVQHWFETHNGGRFAEYAPKFAGVDGKEMTTLQAVDMHAMSVPPRQVRAICTAWHALFRPRYPGANDDDVPWAPHPVATKYMHRLLTMEPDIVPYTDHDVASWNKGSDATFLEVFKMPCRLMDDESDTNSTLVTGPNMRDAWDRALRVTQESKRHRVVVIGSPGHGKSRSIPSFIRHIIVTRRKECRERSEEHSDEGTARACAEHGDDEETITPSADEKRKRALPVVVLEHRKDNRVFMFEPMDRDDPESEYIAWTARPVHMFTTTPPVLDDADNVFIVDAGKVEGSKDPPHVPANTFFVCAPDQRYYSEFAKHATKVISRPWTEASVLAARQFMAPGLLEDTVRERMYMVGPIPRRVFGDDTDYRGYRHALDAPWFHATDDAAAVLHGTRAVDNVPTFQTHPGTFFLVHPTSVDDDPADRHVVVTIASEYLKNRMSIDVAARGDWSTCKRGR